MAIRNDGNLGNGIDKLLLYRTGTSCSLLHRLNNFHSPTVLMSFLTLYCCFFRILTFGHRRDFTFIPVR